MDRPSVPLVVYSTTVCGHGSRRHWRCFLFTLVRQRPDRRRGAARARVPLRDGKLDLGDLSVALCRELHLPQCELGSGLNQPRREPAAPC